MSPEEFDKRYKNDEVFEKKSGIHNKDQICEFVKKLQSKPIDMFDGLSYKFYLCEDYSDNTGVLVL
jgi:hypothetical protein